MSERALLILVLFIILQTGLNIFYWIRTERLMYGLSWLLRHVHVVSKNDAKDPELTRIKQIFGIDTDSKS